MQPPLNSSSLAFAIHGPITRVAFIVLPAGLGDDFFLKARHEKWRNAQEMPSREKLDLLDQEKAQKQQLSIFAILSLVTL
jgi:hypothetical protein